MAFPVSARTTGELVTAAMWNADLKDNLNALYTGALAITSQAALDFVYASSATQLARLAKGSALQVPRINAAGNAWEFGTINTQAKACVLISTADQAIPTGTWTILLYNGEDIDTDGFHSVSTNTGRITIPSGCAGKYHFHCSLTWADVITGLKYVLPYKNGSALYTGSLINFTTGQAEMTMDIVLDMAVGDYLDVRVYHAGGVDIAILGGSAYSRTVFHAHFIGT